VCISDMHLGEEDSLLTSLREASSDIDPVHPSPVMVKLVECLEHLISKNENGKKPSLILNGDILEMALATTNQGYMVFERFMELVMPVGGELFEKIFYIPGNHDHHIWELARETQYVNFISRPDRGDYLPIPWHTTNMFVEKDADPVPSNFLTRLLKSSSKTVDLEIYVAYPNFGVITGDGQRCVIFHHGHFIESLYQLMSILKAELYPGSGMPRLIYDIEAENYAWIDFLWSMLGRSGTVGHIVESIYEELHSPEHFKKRLSVLAGTLAANYGLPRWADWLEAKVLAGLFHYIVDKISEADRSNPACTLSESAESGLSRYMEGPLRAQILTECRESIPFDVSFVFGHTHKPFQKDMNFKGYPRWVNVYNTGGWVVQTVEAEALFGGALALVDEDLNAVSLRMYNESTGKEGYSIRVEEASHAGERTNPFHERMLNLVNPLKEPWRDFSSVVADSVAERAAKLGDRIRGRYK
jgi:hypothetical protein